METAEIWALLGGCGLTNYHLHCLYLIVRQMKLEAIDHVDDLVPLTLGGIQYSLFFKSDLLMLRYACIIMVIAGFCLRVFCLKYM